VVRTALARRRLRDKDILNKIPFVYQFSAPSSGAEIASLAKALRASTNPQLASLIPTGLQQSTELNALESNWAAITPRPTRVFCAYEIRPTYGVLVVSPGSAKTSCDGIADAVDADHLDIVKPTSNHSKAYLLVLDELKKVVPHARFAPPPMKKNGPQSNQTQDILKSYKNDPDTSIVITVKDQNDLAVRGAQIALCGGIFDADKQTNSQGVLEFQVHDRTATCPIAVQADCCVPKEDSINPDEYQKTIYMQRKKSD
jgi:hypothetical protein